MARTSWTMTPRDRAKTLRRSTAALLAIVGLGIVTLLRARERMPNLARWQAALTSRYGSAHAHHLALAMQARYSALRAERPLPRSLAMRLHRNQMILPGVALYLALREDGIEKEAALTDVQSLLLLAPSLLSATIAPLRFTPDPFRALRWVNKISLAVAYPFEGWDNEVVADTRNIFAFNISRCYYLDVFAAHGAPELTALYCQLDDVAFERLPCCVRWERTTTLGRGGQCCDFRWSRNACDSGIGDQLHAGAYLPMLLKGAHDRTAST